MNTRWTICLAATTLVAVFAFSGVGRSSSAVAGDGLVAAGSTVVASSALATGGDGATYIGSNKCKMCHIKQYKSWKKNKHAKVFDILKPGVSSEKKSANNLDPSKDYTKDAKCLECHTVGFGASGGYAVPPDGDKKAAKKVKHLIGVGCESCHGAGESYMALHMELLKSKRSYKVEEMYAAGMTKVDVSVCTKCHNERSPTFEPFDFEERKKLGVHDSIPLKQRE
jgi:hypothetical protein